ncbi:MAG: HAD family hydrolase [Oscillochloris sp.]|nr:HAD family hydrolase [Oscillochloris sp.]
MQDPTSYLIDMDGVLMRGSQPIPGANEFIRRLHEAGRKFLLLTNNPLYTPRDLAARLNRNGLEVPADSIYTSALATVSFLKAQKPDGTAYVVGDVGLTAALHDAGFTLTEHDPDYVVVGETKALGFEQITRAVRLVAGGARFVATNPDVSGPGDGGIEPACGAIAALIAAATGIQPYFVGKPNPLMMRSALRAINAHSEEAVMVGDRMDTDIIGGTESGMRTILVLSGVTRADQVERFPYRPTQIVNSVADIVV